MKGYLPRRAICALGFEMHPERSGSQRVTFHQSLILRADFYRTLAMNQSDVEFMKMAIEFGKQSKGTTGDNPYVGAVLVKNGLIIGSGRTQPPGKEHAEVMAVQNAESSGAAVEGSTLYSTVEPCSFFGRTPSCAKMLVEKQIRRVVIGICDPHPKVNGTGIEILKSANIEVTEGVCKSQVREYLSDWHS